MSALGRPDEPSAEAASPQAVREEALVFDCAGEQLLGVFSEAAAPSELGVLVVVGGPQYRAGSHRQFVHLARACAGAGFPSFRFDVRGMGDSGGAQRSFEQIGDDIEAALEAILRRSPSLRRVVLVGLCDGASAALLYLHSRPADRRVAGLCVFNPWVRSAESLAQTHIKHYYLQRLRSREFWHKLLRGGVALGALRSFLGSLALALRRRATAAPDRADDAPFQHRMASAWARFGGPILLVLSGQDYTAKEFSEAWRQAPEWRPAQGHTGTSRVELAQADHTFSRGEDQREVEQCCVDWLRSLAAAGTAR